MRRRRGISGTVDYKFTAFTRGRPRASLNWDTGFPNLLPLTLSD